MRSVAAPINLGREIKKTNWIFVAMTINSIFFMLISFFATKITISYYGESVNGVLRFSNQIIMYFWLGQTSILLIFQIKIIQLYNRSEKEKIPLTVRYLGRVTKLIGVFFLIFVLALAWVPAHVLSSQSVTPVLVYFLFLALTANVFCSLFFFDKNHTLMVATNKAYVSFFIRTVVKLIVFGYFLITVLLYPPTLIYVMEKGRRILTFAPKDLNKVYALGVGYVLLGLEPLFSGVLLTVFIKKTNNEVFIYSPEEYAKYKGEIKKEVWSGVAKGIILNLTVLVIFSTDEFVMLLLKGKFGGLGILKFIGTYGLYASTTTSLRLLIENYILSKKVLIGHSKNNVVERKKIMKEIKTRTHFLSAVFLIFSVFVLPFLISFLFAPNSKISYVNFNLSIPIAIFGWIVLINTPNKIELEIDNKLKILIAIFAFEALINLFLSVTLAVYTGVVYWILWGSVFAALIKLGIFEIYVWKTKGTKFLKILNINQFFRKLPTLKKVGKQKTSKASCTGNFLFFRNKKLCATLSVLLLTLVATTLLMVFKARVLTFLNSGVTLNSHIWNVLICAGLSFLYVASFSLIIVVALWKKSRQKIKNQKAFTTL